MRRLFVDAIHSFITTGVRTEPSEADASASTYVPSKKLQALVRAGELCCTFPGCNQPVWTVDLDHTHPFDHTNPRPRWQDPSGQPETVVPVPPPHQDLRGGVAGFARRVHVDLVRSAHRHVYLGNPYTGRDLFSSLKTQPPDHPARRRLDDERAARTDTHRRQQDDWDRKNPPPF